MSEKTKGRKITLDPVLPQQDLVVRPKRVESAIGAGLRVEWLSGDTETENGVISFDMTCGAGVGSPYLTLVVTLPDGSRREEVVDMREVAEAWVNQVVDGEPTPAPPVE